MMGSIHILHDSAPTGQIGPYSYALELWKLRGTPRKLLQELSNFRTRVWEYWALTQISEAERMALYARLDNYVGDGSCAFIWEHLWTTREDAALAYVRSGLRQRIRDERGYERVLAFQLVRT